MKRLGNNNIKALCIFRKDKQPKEERNFRDRNLIVACEVVSDLLNIGLKGIDIAKGNTRLTKLIGEYVDMKLLVKHRKILPQEHHENRSSSEAPQSRTLLEQVAKNQHQDALVGGRPREHSSQQAIKPATKLTSVTTLPGTQEPIQRDRGSQESLSTSTKHSANEHRAASKAAPNHIGHLSPSANSARKRQNTGNEGGFSSIPLINSCTVTVRDSETPCNGKSGQHNQHPEGALNHQAVASQSLQSSGRTNNHDSHATLGTGRVAISPHQEPDEEQQSRSL